MNKKDIKQFYLSLIDNPDAKWSLHKQKDRERLEYILYNCEINKITIKSYIDFQISFNYENGNHWNNSSDIVNFSDIGISKFQLLFPYFGIYARIGRRIKREEKKKNLTINTRKIDSVVKILSKDKALVRDNKIDQILN